MVPRFARAFAIVVLSLSSAVGSSNEEHCDETSLVQLTQKVRLASEHQRDRDGTLSATATDLRMEFMRRAFVARLAWEKIELREKTPEKATPKHNQSIDDGEIDKDSAEELAAVKMAYKRRLIEREITDKEIEFNKAAAKAKIAEGQAALDKVEAKALDKVKEAEAKATAAKATWEEAITKNAGLDDPGDLKTVAEKKAAHKLEKTLTDEWEAEHGKANAKRTATEMGARQRITVQDYFADMADVQRLTADTDDAEVEEFSKKVAHRTAAEKAAMAKITQMNYAADTRAAAEVDAIEAKVNAQLMDEEDAINSKVAPAQKKTAVKKVRNSSEKDQDEGATLGSSKAAQEEDLSADDNSSKDEPAQDDGAEQSTNLTDGAEQSRALKSLMKTFSRDDD